MTILMHVIFVSYVNFSSSKNTSIINFQGCLDWRRIRSSLIVKIPSTFYDNPEEKIINIYKLFCCENCYVHLEIRLLWPGHLIIGSLSVFNYEIKQKSLLKVNLYMPLNVELLQKTSKYLQNSKTYLSRKNTMLNLSQVFLYTNNYILLYLYML